jgi:iron complex outermembrane receptor protein
VRRLFGDVGWRGDASRLNVSSTAASNDLTGNGAAPRRLLDASRAAVFTHPDRTDNDLALLTLKAQHRRSATTIFDTVAYYRYNRIGTFNGDADGDDDDEDEEEEEEDDEDQHFDAVNNLSRTRGNAAGATVQLTRVAPFLGKENHFIAGAGLDAASSAFDFVAELAHLTPDRGTIGSGLFDADTFVDLDSRTMTGSAFLTNTWTPTDRLSLTASARFNWTAVRLRDRIGTALTGDHVFHRLNPAGGVTYQLRPGVNVYGSYTQSSRVPTPVELTCADPEDPCRLPNAFVSDPPLEQVTAATWEAGARGTVGRATWNLSSFTTSSRDDIVFVSSGTLRGEGHFENVERTTRTGIEATVDYTVGDRVSAFASYTLLRATFGTDLRIASRFHPLADDGDILVRSGDRLPGVPAHSAKLGVTAAVTSGLQFRLTARARSGQPIRGDEANLLPPLPGFAVVNAQVRQRITRRLAAIAQLQNLFDTDYATFGVLGDAALLGEAFESDPRFDSPGAPRAGWIGVEVRF